MGDLGVGSGWEEEAAADGGWSMFDGNQRAGKECLAGRRGGGVYNLSDLPRVRLSDSDAREKSGLTARAKGDKSQVVLSSV